MPENTEAGAFENPINPDKVAENPGLLPYAHNAGSAVIRPEDEGKIKAKALTAMRQQTGKQYDQLAGQMKTLLDQAKAIQKRVEVSERVYTAAINFEPFIGQTMYLYEKADGSDLLSLVAPHEWGRSFKYNRYVAQVTMLYDHTWDVLFYNDEGDEERVEI
ncbi:hypothetical protein BWI93_26915 [Siphonobacter sp. BAB-5385]|uniref:DUF2452 domain-containing protein n=1 Tax=Siphonobacter curvatus TaxID=2094562 RepID=A0A2S7IQE4_9BACT|nr:MULTISPECIES: DUF2452 domain-containing protein [Siphonobacter]OZI05180.1 hypothetical protein BWI93_26915 [Siphonobacter sp. BAB-5385]PMD98824.1 hypothetical protein BWI97_03145 [Siphonobacter sp. BAB-5405]PQA59934.1 DUF2452 domain-containing protein [Siphonobacter curvatus]